MLSSTLRPADVANFWSVYYEESLEAERVLDRHSIWLDVVSLSMQVLPIASIAGNGLRKQIAFIFYSYSYACH